MEAEKLARKYHHSMADTYDSLREGEPQWVGEQRIVEGFLPAFPRGTKVLDVPVGTGRFLKAYVASGFQAVGLDASSSMLAKARAKAEAGGWEVQLQEGSIYSLPFPDRAFDLVVCIRFMDWVAGDSFRKALSELARVSRDAIIVEIPTFTPFLDIRPFTLSGLGRLLRQWKLRFYMLRTRSESVVHRREDVFALFEHLGLRVEQRLCVDEPTERTWRMGNERDVYLLRTQRGG
jgi:ubiquinone/menaquinone biosynthesis C-methylase UbiE